MKAIYLLIGSGLAISAIKFSLIKNKQYVIPGFLAMMAYCFSFWGISSIFHNAEGYPPQWFFYVTVMPVFASVVILVLNIKK